MYELRSTHPSIDLSLFKIRSFSVPLTGVSLAFAAMQGTLLFLTFYYQIVRGWSPLQAGLLVLPFAVGQLLGAPRSSRMVNRFGARTVITVGLLFALAGMLCFAFISPGHARSGSWWSSASSSASAWATPLRRPPPG